MFFFLKMSLFYLLVKVAYGECTLIIFGRKATEHGFPVVTHANDCAECDSRMAYVPGRNHSDEVRLVFNGSDMSFPRPNDQSRSLIYSQQQAKPVGSIPQVERTHALWEAAYPLMNEHGLAFGESTTFGKAEDAQWERPPLFAIATLMAIALERCVTARCAIATMGSLAEQKGYFGESANAGEAVGIVDKTEAWVFEVTGNGSLWVAQKVPEDHVAVIANSMVISQVDFADSDNFMFSKILPLEAANHSEPFNWRKSRSPVDGHPPYAYLRMWRVYDRVAKLANIQIPSSSGNAQYPFSAKVDMPLAIKGIIDIHRDHYEGTPYDMTKGIMAGPHGNPNYELAGYELKYGSIPRAISLMRTSYCHVSTSGPLATIWFAPDAPATSVFVPFFATATDYSPLYGNTQGPSVKTFDRTSAFWAFDFVANWMTLNYQNMSQEMVFPARDDLQAWVFNETLQLNDENLTVLQIKVQNHVTASWWKLADSLIARYNDGFYNFGPTNPTSISALPMPEWWLQMIGLDNSFIRPSLHLIRPAVLKNLWDQIFSSFIMLLIFIVGLFTGWFLNRRRPHKEDEGYLSLKNTRLLSRPDSRD